MPAVLDGGGKKAPPSVDTVLDGATVALAGVSCEGVSDSKDPDGETEC